MTVNPRLIRRQQDFEKLQNLQRKAGSILQILQYDQVTLKNITLRLNLTTPVDSGYPARFRSSVDILIELPPDYPFHGPNVSFQSAVWNPNVFPSGKLCYGEWVVTENLEMLVKRIMQIVVLDSRIINTQSPANQDAEKWYSSKMRENSRLFPTVNIERVLNGADKPAIRWTTIR